MDEAQRSGGIPGTGGNGDRGDGEVYGGAGWSTSGPVTGVSAGILHPGYQSGDGEAIYLYTYRGGSGVDDGRETGNGESVFWRRR